MAKTFKILSVGSLITIMIFMMVPTYASAAEAAIPDWVPKKDQVEGFGLLWNGTQTIEGNFFTGDDKANLTFINQLWYKNDSANQVMGVIAASFVDVGENIWNEDPRPSTILCKSIFDGAFPDFKGTNRWDFFVYLMNKTTDGLVVETTLSGFDHAMESNSTGSGFNYLLIGVVGSRIVVSMAFDVEYYQDWFSVAALGVGALITLAINGLILGMAALTNAFIACDESMKTTSAPASAAVVPTAANYTSSDLVKSFTATVGKIIAPASGIPGYPVMIVAVVSLLTVAILFKKKHH